MTVRTLLLTGIGLVVVLTALSACGGQEPTALPGCENAPRPIVFVHGFMGGGDNYAKTVMRFGSNGYCPEYLRAFDWNTLSFDMEGNVEDLVAFIDQVLKETHAEKVDLVGHSRGGQLGYEFLSDEKRAKKVAHYVHVASFCDLEFPGSVPVLVLSSDEDTVVGPCSIEGAENQDVDGADHLQMVTLPEVFVAMFRFFNDGQRPVTADILPQGSVTLAGKALAFGTNQPAVGAVVEIYPLNAATGERLEANPAARFTVGEDGVWGPFPADPSTFYEFMISETGPRPFHYYRQPFSHSDALVYLRVVPDADPLLDLVLGAITYDDRSSILVLFSANQALYHGRDTATLDGLDLATPEMVPPPPDRTSTIAIFIFDTDGDGQTDGGPIPIQIPALPFLRMPGGAQGSDQPSEFPFFRQYDAFLDASTRRTVTVTMNGAALNVPTWKSDSEGVIVVVFD